ncbi:protein of unknown function [Azospirillum baldaniorum]|uniref:Uncharacterized protein n=1 Tax=Azospirillum baldaniorum TaxID=1064539 RepID=A0A9P1NM29_9PROT|nr:protein of unknown function [Azospirillum baldaniorum]
MRWRTKAGTCVPPLTKLFHKTLYL